MDYNIIHDMKSYKLSYLLAILILAIGFTTSVFVFKTRSKYADILCPKKYLTLIPSVLATTPEPSFEHILCLMSKPKLNQPVRILYKFIDKFYQAQSPRTNLAAKIEIPESFTLLNGNLEWEGNMPGDGEESLEVTVRPTKAGNFSIVATITNGGSSELVNIDFEID